MSNLTSALCAKAFSSISGEGKKIKKKQTHTRQFNTNRKEQSTISLSNAESTNTGRNLDIAQHNGAVSLWLNWRTQ